MANVKLLRQRVTDYQRNFDLSRQRYLKSYDKYAADSEAFQAHYSQYPAYDGSSADANTAYYDRETDSVKDVYGREFKTVSIGRVRNASTGMKGSTFDYSTPGAAHMDAAQIIQVDGKWVSTSSPEAQATIAAAQAQYDLDAAAYNNMASGQDGGYTPYPEFKPGVDAYWDAYSNTWRNFRAAPGVPEQRRTLPPNLTQKEVGILQGEVNYADQAKQDTSPTSAFADPEDPYNLKDAGVLARSIAGKI